MNSHRQTDEIIAKARKESFEQLCYHMEMLATYFLGVNEGFEPNSKEHLKFAKEWRENEDNTIQIGLISKMAMEALDGIQFEAGQKIEKLMEIKPKSAIITDLSQAIN